MLAAGGGIGGKDGIDRQSLLLDGRERNAVQVPADLPEEVVLEPAVELDNALVQSGRRVRLVHHFSVQEFQQIAE